MYATFFVDYVCLWHRVEEEALALIAIHLRLCRCTLHYVITLAGRASYRIWQQALAGKSLSTCSGHSLSKCKACSHRTAAYSPIRFHSLMYSTYRASKQPRLIAKSLFSGAAAVVVTAHR
jgi:hypothetical protein